MKLAHLKGTEMSEPVQEDVEFYDSLPDSVAPQVWCTEHGPSCPWDCIR